MSSHSPDAGQLFTQLVEIMARLRAPDGCPWDQKQTFDTIKPFLLEETYEVMDAIDQRDWHGLAEELGDLLLQPVFFAQMAAEENRFTIADSLTAINEKLIRRHPHVFADATAHTPEDVKKRWDEIKLQEKVEKGIDVENGSILDHIPRSLPALAEAQKISKKAAGAGFDWPDISGVTDKIKEEVTELAEARAAMSQEKIEDELGDVLFSIVNLARFLKVDSEQALRKTNAKFRRRFAYVEAELKRAEETMQSVTLDRMEELWQSAKKKE